MRKYITETDNALIVTAVKEPFDSLIYYAENAGHKKIVKRLKELNKEWRKNEPKED